MELWFPARMGPLTAYFQTFVKKGFPRLPTVLALCRTRSLRIGAAMGGVEIGKNRLRNGSLCGRDVWTGHSKDWSR